MYRSVDKPLGDFTFYLGISFDYWPSLNFYFHILFFSFPYGSFFPGFPLGHLVLNQVHIFREPNISDFGTLISLSSIVKDFDYSHIRSFEF